jgi:hypothetical protein
MWSARKWLEKTVGRGMVVRMKIAVRMVLYCGIIYRIIKSWVVGRGNVLQVGVSLVRGCLVQGLLVRGWIVRGWLVRGWLEGVMLVGVGSYANLC